MGLIIGLLLVGIVVTGLSYILQFSIELDGNKEKLIKDGLVKELITKATTDPDPNSFIVDRDSGTITMGRVVIRKHFINIFWFPYEVKVVAKSYHERKNDDDWGYDVGYVTRYSKDYYIINKILKKSKVGIEQTQRQKLNLNK